MSPTEVSSLAPGQWVRWTPTIWSSGIDGRVLNVIPEGIHIKWDDGAITTVPRDRLAWATFERLYLEPLNEAEGDEYAEAYLRWTESSR